MATRTTPKTEGTEKTPQTHTTTVIETQFSQNIVKLAIEGGCNSVASTMGVRGAIAPRYAYKIPSIAKINHNELLTYPNKYDQIHLGQVERAYDMDAAAVGATVDFGSAVSHRHLLEIGDAFSRAHELGMATSERKGIDGSFAAHASVAPQKTQHEQRSQAFSAGN